MEGSDSRQRLRYRFDNLLARGTWATLLWLGIITLAVVAVAALALALFDVTFAGSEGSSYLEDLWQSLLRVMDPGTMAGDVGWGRRLGALFITLFGLLVAGTLIGIIAAGVEDRIQRMRRARSAVFESGHVVVLGSSDRLPLLIRQLVLARANKPNSVIVVMMDGDPAEAQDTVRGTVDDLRGSRLVFRSGDPTSPSDLALVRLEKAEMVIVLTHDDAGDARAIRTVIAVASALGEDDSTPIVVELSDVASAQRVAAAYPGRVHPLVPNLAVSRIATAALREPGVGHVVMALLDDRGSDVHISSVPSLEGLRFVDILNADPAARPVGIMRSDGTTELNPSPETRLGRGDRLVVVSNSPEDMTAVDGSSLGSAGTDIHTVNELNFDQPDQHLLVLGWSDLAAAMLVGWGEVATTSSSVDVLADPGSFDPSEMARVSEVVPNLTLTEPDGSSHVAQRLQESPRIDTILLCASPTELGAEAADSRTLLDLVAIRRLIGSLPEPHPRLIIEILDAANIALVGTLNADDFVVSEAIASQLIAQLAEQPESRGVFLQLYDPSGPSVHLVPATTLGLQGLTRASDMYASAYRFGVLAIGWRRTASDAGRLVINPHQSQEIDLDPSDQIVVIG